MIKPKTIQAWTPETTISSEVIKNLLSKNGFTLPTDNTFKTILIMIEKGLFVPSQEEIEMIKIIKGR